MSTLDAILTRAAAMVRRDPAAQAITAAQKQAQETMEKPRRAALEEYKQAELGKLPKANRDAIRKAVKDGRTDDVKDLLDHGVDVNTRLQSGGTLLTMAVRKNHVNVVQLLLERGADQHAKTSGGHTALDLAKSLDVKAALHRATSTVVSPCGTTALDVSRDSAVAPAVESSPKHADDSSTADSGSELGGDVDNDEDEVPDDDDSVSVDGEDGGGESEEEEDDDEEEEQQQQQQAVDAAGESKDESPYVINGSEEEEEEEEEGEEQDEGNEDDGEDEGDEGEDEDEENAGQQGVPGQGGVVEQAGRQLVAIPPRWWHLPVYTQTTRDCRLCVDRSAGKDSRRTTRVKCETCGVFLCVKPPGHKCVGGKGVIDEVDNCYKIWHLSPDPRKHSRSRGVADKARNFKCSRAEFDDGDADNYLAIREALGKRRKKRKRRQ